MQATPPTWFCEHIGADVYKTPHNWLWYATARAVARGDVAWLATAVAALSMDASDDRIMHLYHDEMEADGY
jgi:hypothetical protein